jgi:hypothetical protein
MVGRASARPCRDESRHHEEASAPTSGPARWLSLLTSRIARIQASITGIPPDRAALLLTVGLVIGVFPMAFIPTLMCLLAALVLRLNAPALQLLNSISSPLQIALLVPLARTGDRLLGHLPSGKAPWLAQLAASALHAVAGWATLCVPCGVLLYFILLAAIRLNPLSRTFQQVGQHG